MPRALFIIGLSLHLALFITDPFMLLAILIFGLFMLVALFANDPFVHAAQFFIDSFMLVATEATSKCPYHNWHLSTLIDSQL